MSKKKNKKTSLFYSPLCREEGRHHRWQAELVLLEKRLVDLQEAAHHRLQVLLKKLGGDVPRPPSLWWSQQVEEMLPLVLGFECFWVLGEELKNVEKWILHRTHLNACAPWTFCVLSNWFGGFGYCICHRICIGVPLGMFGMKKTRGQIQEMETGILSPTKRK